MVGVPADKGKQLLGIDANRKQVLTDLSAGGGPVARTI